MIAEAEKRQSTGGDVKFRALKIVRRVVVVFLAV